MKSKIGILVIGCIFLANVYAASAAMESCRKYPTPVGWNDDMEASMEKAAMAGEKELLVYFPPSVDEAFSSDGKRHSPISSWSNSDVLAMLGKNYVLVFDSWNRNPGREWISRMKTKEDYKLYPSPQWGKARADVASSYPMIAIMKSDGDLVWRSNWLGVADEETVRKFVADELPLMRTTLKRYYSAKKTIACLNDETQIAKALYDVFKDCDYRILKRYFPDEGQRMVNADKTGDLGIRDKYPYFCLLQPLIKLNQEFFFAQHACAREIQNKDKGVSLDDAVLKATLSLRSQWEPKFKKAVIAAKKIAPRLQDSEDKKYLDDLRRTAEELIKVWNGEATKVPRM